MPSCWFPLDVSGAACRLGVVRCSVFRPRSVNVLYLVNSRIGAVAYNAAHTTIVYGPLAAYGYLSGVSVALAVGLIGLAHVGFDRLLGYGLKYPLGFGYTHLGRLGKEASYFPSQKCRF